MNTVQRIRLKKPLANASPAPPAAVILAAAESGAPPIRFDRDRMHVTFDRFDLASYRLFLKCKALPESIVTFHAQTESYTLSAPARFAALLGVNRPAIRESFPLLPSLFEDQHELCSQALDCKRFALWCLCGWGKTVVGWEFARQASLRTGGGRALIVTTNDLVKEWLDQLRTFYGDSLPVVRLKSRQQLREWCEHGTIDGIPTAAKLAITNYEKFNPDKGDVANQVVNEIRHLVCVVLDEASRLRNAGGKQKWALVKSCRGVEYKLLLTATPAPNDLMEFASQAAFLEKMRSEGDIIWTFFTRNEKTHRWDVKPHARAAFFEFMANWSIYVHDPKRYGWRLNHPDVPAPEYRVVETPATPDQLEEIPAAVASGTATGQLTMVAEASETNAIQRVKLAEISSGFKYVDSTSDKGEKRKGKAKPVAVRIPSNKPAMVAKIAYEEAVTNGVQVLVWTLFDEETEILAEAFKAIGLPSFEILTGKVKAKDRPAMIDRFKRGETRVLGTRAKMMGYGQNLQMCEAEIFNNFNDSFEDVFQAVHRAVRYGQTKRVRIYFPIVRELQGDVKDNLDRKQTEYIASVKEMENNYIRTRERLKLGRVGAA